MPHILELKEKKLSKKSSRPSVLVSPKNPSLSQLVHYTKSSFNVIMKSLIATNEWKLALFEKRHNYQTIILGTPPRAEVQYIKSAWTWCICSDSNIRLLHRVQLGELLCWLEKRRKKICCLKGGINRIMEFYIWLIVELPRVTNYTYSMVWKGLLVMVSKSDFVFLFMPWLEKLLLAQMQINASFSFLQTLQWFSNKMSTYNR